MQVVGNTGRPRAVRRAIIGVAAAAVALLCLSACTSGASTADHSPAAHDTSLPGNDGTATKAAPAGSAPAPQPAVITTSDLTHKISPSKPVTVAISNGKLTGVTMVNANGKHVTGQLSGDGTSWQNTEDLGYSKTYKITATGTNDQGGQITKHASVSTITPGNMTMPYLQRIGGYPLGHGATYGVGIVPVVHFDEPITNKAAAERALKVTTTPHVDGVWSWIDDQNVHYRPEGYWPSGTKVTVAADVYGVEVGKGLYGQSDVSASFTVGRKQLTIAYDRAPKAVNKVKVYDASGKLLRTMNTSMGTHGGVTVNGNYINFYTLNGTYTVLGHEQPARMCSASYGLPANGPGGYACEDIYNATKISNGGIYLHELLTTIWAQNSGQDVSHGCLNLNASNSLWFFDHSMVGDPVVIHGAKHAPDIEWSDGGDWSVPWSTWLKNSALH